MSNAITVSGWLRKSPPEKKLRKNAWRKRWFVLRSGRLSGNPNLLEYYKHQGSKKPIGAISLDECSQIDANVPVKYERKDPAHQFVFDIVTRTRTYYLVAESLHEMSFWVRHLCELCGFNHDAPDNQEDLSSQQQTFRANQSISRGNYQNGTTSLLENEQELSSDAPPPLPRPHRTMTERSILITNRGATDPVTPLDPNGSTSTESNQPSISDTPGSLRRIDTRQNNGHSYPVNSNADQVHAAKPEDSEDYLLLSDFKTQTAQNPIEVNHFPPADDMRERRSSSDSVFTHEGAPSDGGSDAIVEQFPHVLSSRYAASIKQKQRLDSMPDCPPPPPPVKTHTERPLITKIDERGYPIDVDDDNDDDVKEARKRSARISGGLPPFDDSDLDRVPLSLQKDFGVDEMGKQLPGGYNTSSGYETEYINTADASAEARFGNLSHRSDGVSGLFYSPNNRPAMAQATNFSSVFFTSPGLSESSHFRHQHYDTPSPVVPMYASPRTASPHHALTHKSSLYSSTNTLSPFGFRPSPVRLGSPQPTPVHGPRIRRSSSVGQLENHSNELAMQTGVNSDSPVRRSSIDQRHPFYNIPLHPAMVHPALCGAPFPMPDLISSDPPNVPPPRPPKLDASSKKFLPDPDSSEYYNLSGCYTDGFPRTEVPPSPPHTEVVSFRPDLEDSPATSPPHSTIVRTVPIEEADAFQKVNKTSEAESSRTSSSSGGSLTGSSSGRSSAAAVYDVTAPSYRDSSTAAPIYDTPRKITEPPLRVNDVYDTPKSFASNLYNIPNSKAAHLPDIDENRPDYERMLDQPPPIGDEVQAYTCMVGATSLVNTPPYFRKPPISPKIGGGHSATSEPPPVKRDLKPKVGRTSLGSDGGSSDISKHHHLSRGSYDEPPFEQSTRSANPPISPPHVVLMHTTPPSTSVLPPPSVNTFVPARPHDRLQPPGRPPKITSQSSLSPRTPPSIAVSSHLPDRPPPYNSDRSRHTPDGLPLSNKQKPPPYAPGRPPKPSNMLPGVSPSPFQRDDGSFRHHRGQVYPSSSAFTHGFKNSYPHVSASAVVPPPPSDQLTYIEVGQFESGQPRSGGAVDVGVSSERMAKGDNVVEYSVLDPEKTEALQKMKVEREKEQLKRGSADSRSIKGGKT